MNLSLIDLLIIMIVAAAISLLVKQWQSSLWSLSSWRKWKPLLTNEIHSPVTPLEMDQTKRNQKLKRSNVSYTFLVFSLCTKNK